MGKENLFFSKSHFFKYIKERLFKSINLFAPSFSSLCSQLPSVPLNPSSCLGKLHGCLSFVKCFLAHHDDSEYWTYVCMHCEGWNWVYLEKAEHCAPRWSHINIKRLRTLRDLLPFQTHPQFPEFPALSAISELLLSNCFAPDLSIRSCHDNIFAFLCFSPVFC